MAKPHTHHGENFPDPGHPMQQVQQKVLPDAEEYHSGTCLSTQVQGNESSRPRPTKAELQPNKAGN